MNRKIFKLINAFDEAARDWGYTSDQGTGNDVAVSKAKYEAAKEALIAGAKTLVTKVKKTK